MIVDASEKPNCLVKKKFIETENISNLVSFNRNFKAQLTTKNSLFRLSKNTIRLAAQHEIAKQLFLRNKEKG